MTLLESFPTNKEDSQRDLPLVRMYKLENGNEVKLQREDPYGFWYLNFIRGQMPESLRGAFTSADKADQALRNYLTNKGRQIIEHTRI